MTKYLLEAIDDGVWVTVHESSDPFSIMTPTIELSSKNRSTRTTVIHDDDKLAVVIGNVRDTKQQSDVELHAQRRHPLYEYATTEGPRKTWHDADVAPPGDGWERNFAAGRSGWERFDHTEESYWRRLRSHAPIATLPADLQPAVSTKTAEQLANKQTVVPSVGRIVHYRTGDRTLAAIITQVGLLQTGARVPDVKLHIFWPSDDTDARPDGGWYRHSDDLEAGCWSWPSRA